MQIIFKGKTKTGKEIVVRYPELGDEKEMLAYINKLSKEKTFIRLQGEELTLVDETKYLKSQLEKIKNNKTVQLLVFNNKKLVGISGIDMKDKTEKHLGVLGISIAKDFRSDGLGKLLMELILKEAENTILELKIVTLEVYSTNNVARNLYKKFEFKEYGNLPNGVTRRNKFEDAIFMYKNINTLV